MEDGQGWASRVTRRADLSCQYPLAAAVRPSGQRFGASWTNRPAKRKLSTMGEHRIRTADARFLVIRDDEATTQLTTETAVRNRP